MSSDHEQSLIVDGLNINQLDNDELYERLTKFGVTIGPVVDSTRRMYCRKLAVLMGGTVPGSEFNEVDEDDTDGLQKKPEPSPPKKELRQRIVSPAKLDSSPPKRELKQQFIPTAKLDSSPPKKELKQRFISTGKSTETEDEPISPTTPFTFNPSLHTPSPRRSLRSVHGNPELNRSRTQESSQPETKQSSSSLLRVFVKLILFCILFTAIYYAYQSTYSESPYIGLEQMAKQAMEAVQKQKSDSPEVKKE